MKYFKILIILIIGTFVTNVYAIAGPVHSSTGLSTNKLFPGEIFNVTEYVSVGNTFAYDKDDKGFYIYHINNIYDNDIFEFIAFKSDCDFKYDDNKMEITRNGNLIPNSCIREENNVQIPSELFTLTLRVKENVETCKEVIIMDKKYTIYPKDTRPADGYIAGECEIDKNEETDKNDNMNTDNENNNVNVGNNNDGDSKRKNGVLLMLISNIILFVVVFSESIYLLALNKKTKNSNL